MFDSWYFNERFVDHIESRGSYWISKARSDNLIWFLNRNWCRVDDLVKVIPSVKYRRFVYTNSRGEKQNYYIYGFVGKVKHLGGRKYRIVIVKSSWETTNMNEISVIVSNHTGLGNEEIFTRYKRRWEIECVFRELKDNFYFDRYQVRSLAAIMKHWHLCFLAYTFLP
ncbi:MAG: transposase [bacterium]|nr:transposase [bacterium]